MLRIFILNISLLLIGFALGCGNSTDLQDQASSTENQLSVILAPLNEDRPTLVTYRSVMQNLNGYFDSLGEKYRNEIVLSPEQLNAAQQLLQGAARLEIARRVEDLKSKSFNALGDASHLDACLLFRDAAHSLVADLGEAPPASDPSAVESYQLDLAQHIFGWTSRQVVLKPHAGTFEEHWPPHDILRRGSSDVQERILVFLSILGQTDLPGCAILIKKPFKEDNLTVTRSVPILAGVLIGKSMYLFDPHLGKPVLAPDGKGVATLAQLQEQGDKLKTLLGPDAPSATQLKNAELVAYASLPGLAPRMRVLEREFDQQNNRLRLYDDLAGRIARFKAAGFNVKPWASESRPGEPALLLHRYVENPQADPRFAYVQALRQKLVPSWALEAEKQLGIPGTQQSILYEFDRRFLSLRFEPGGGRDLLVRGKTPQAIAKIAKYENDLDRALDLFHKEPPAKLESFRSDFVKEAAVIRGEVIQAYNDWQRAQRSGAAAAQVRQLDGRFAQARVRYESIWKGDLFRTMANNLGSEWAIPELREHITYFIGLGKMELALRAERLLKKNPKAPWPADLPTPAEQFASAAQWFGRYEALVLPMDSAIWLDAVKARHAECDQKLAELAQLAKQ